VAIEQQRATATENDSERAIHSPRFIFLCKIKNYLASALLCKGF